MQLRVILELRILMNKFILKASIPTLRGPQGLPVNHWSSGAGCAPQMGGWSGPRGLPVGLHIAEWLTKGQLQQTKGG